MAASTSAVAAEGISAGAGEASGSDGGGAAATCCVCQSAAATHGFAPCGHQCVCAECGGRVMAESNKQCPLCRVALLCCMQIYT